MKADITDLGYVNRNDQMVLQKIDESSTERLRTMFLLRCLECEHEYGATASDIDAHRCPICDSGTHDLADAA